MKKSITYQAIDGPGTKIKSTYYWNGYEFITSVKVTFSEDVINEQYVKAKMALPELVAYNPDAYEFGIK